MTCSFIDETDPILRKEGGGERGRGGKQFMTVCKGINTYLTSTIFEVFRKQKQSQKR